MVEIILWASDRIKNKCHSLLTVYSKSLIGNHVGFLFNGKYMDSSLPKIKLKIIRLVFATSPSSIQLRSKSKD